MAPDDIGQAAGQATQRLYPFTRVETVGTMLQALMWRQKDQHSEGRAHVYRTRNDCSHRHHRLGSAHAPPPLNRDRIWHRRLSMGAARQE
jgi:hypothetical protein